MYLEGKYVKSTGVKEGSLVVVLATVDNLMFWR